MAPNAHRSIRLPRLAAAILTLVLVAAGCQSYLDDSAARTPGEVTDDLSIHTMIKTRMLRDPEVGGLRINVDVAKGVVTLSGKVRSESERRRAVEIATSVPNVARVVADLVVRM